MSRDDKQQVVVLIPKWIHKLARRKAFETRTPMAKVMREALCEWATEDKPDDRERRK